MTDPVLDKLCGDGRDDVPLSFLDLIERDTFDLDLAAWLVSQVAGGASWVTGSGPGGIGKTTIMRSLLSFVPEGLAFAEALPGQVASIQPPSKVVVSHELSDHPPPTYLWDQDLRDYFALADADHTLVGNVHADDVAEIRKEIVGDCQVPEAQFRAVGLWIFVKMEGQDPEARRIKDTTSRRFVNRIFWSDGAGDHTLVYTPESGLADGAHRDAADEARQRQRLDALLAGEARTVQAVRAAWLKG